MLCTESARFAPDSIDILSDSKEECEFIDACAFGDLITAQRIVLLTNTYIHACSWNIAFGNACARGHISIAKWLRMQANPDIDITYNDSHAFRLACVNGHIEVVYWLWDIGHGVIDVGALDDDAFRCACANGHLTIARFIWCINPSTNMSACNDYAFTNACMNNHVNVAVWLMMVWGKRINRSQIACMYAWSINHNMRNLECMLNQFLCV